MVQLIQLNEPHFCGSNGSGLWQAYHSAASLGFPLSLPAACGRYEIYHLKVPHFLRYLEEQTKSICSPHTSVGTIKQSCNDFIQAMIFDD